MSMGSGVYAEPEGSPVNSSSALSGARLAGAAGLERARLFSMRCQMDATTNVTAVMMKPKSVTEASTKLPVTASDASDPNDAGSMPGADGENSGCRG